MRRFKRSGFTLVEQLVATLIFSVTATGVYSIVSHQTNLLRKTRERNYVTRIVDSRIEELRELTFDEIEDLPATIEFDVRPAVTVFDEAVNEDIVDDAYEMALDGPQGFVFIDSPGANLKKITVRVTWQAGFIAKRPASMEMVTYITRNGVSRK